MPEAHKPVGKTNDAGEREAIAQAMRQHTGPERRREPRLALDDSFQLVVRIGGGQYLTVTPRDISSNGLGFYHLASVAPGSEVSLVMQAKGHGAVTRKGTVVRCRHVSGGVHEVGVLFEEQIEVAVVVAGTKADQAASPQAQKFEPNDVYARISEATDRVRALTAERAELSAILERAGELVRLLASHAGPSKDHPAAGPPHPTTRKPGQPPC